MWGDKFSYFNIIICTDGDTVYKYDKNDITLNHDYSSAINAVKINFSNIPQMFRAGWVEFKFGNAYFSGNFKLYRDNTGGNVICEISDYSYIGLTNLNFSSVLPIGISMNLNNSTSGIATLKFRCGLNDFGFPSTVSWSS